MTSVVLSNRMSWTDLAVSLGNFIYTTRGGTMSKHGAAGIR